MKLAITLILSLNVGIVCFVIIGEAGTKMPVANAKSADMQLDDLSGDSYYSYLARTKDTELASAAFAVELQCDYAPRFDTVWVLGDAFILVDLAAQHLHLYRRGVDSVLSIPVSSGNPRIHDGMDTPTGIYSVQTKSPLAISRQYDNAKMFHWIGFHYNIGAHGLVGNSYYRHLGVRPSSHGCLRVGREAIEGLYPLVPYGTPVLVHKERPARTFAFADKSRFNRAEAVRLTSMSKVHNRLMQSRLTRLYSGRSQLEYLPEVYLDGVTQLRPGGYSVGHQDSVVVQQSAIIVNSLHRHHSFGSDQLDWRPGVLYDSLTHGLHVAVRFRTEELPRPSLSAAHHLAQ